MPTVLVHGDADETSPLSLTAERTAKLIPGARLAIYEAGHGLPLTHAARLNRDIPDFARG